MPEKDAADKLRLDQVQCAKPAVLAACRLLRAAAG
jgi:hypothetical protein